jgi:hypothetical protein
MGMFSFACARCGEKEQFDWSHDAVVAFQSGTSVIFVKGEYNAYGAVEVAVFADGEDDTSIGVRDARGNVLYQCLRETLGTLKVGVDGFGRNDLEAGTVFCFGEAEVHVVELEQEQADAVEQHFAAAGKVQGGSYGCGLAGFRFCVPETSSGSFTRVFDGLSSKMATELLSLPQPHSPYMLLGKGRSAFGKSLEGDSAASTGPLNRSPRPCLIGKSVTLTGLSTEALNGSNGIAMWFDEVKGRYSICLSSGPRSGDQVGIKAGNLIEASTPENRPGNVVREPDPQDEASSAAQAIVAEPMAIQVKTPAGESHSLEIQATGTVMDIKIQLQERHGLLATHILLFRQGSEDALPNNETISTIPKQPDQKTCVVFMLSDTAKRPTHIAAMPPRNFHADDANSGED